MLNHKTTSLRILAVPLAALVVTVVAVQARGHGEDEAGPHGGVIRMPGAFHTEVSPAGEGFQIHLLDHEFKNPTTKNSNVEASVKPSGKAAGKEVKLECKTEKAYFTCTFPGKAAKPAKGELLLTATREGMKGNVATYPFPLEAPAAQAKPAPKSKSGHGHQHH